MALINHQECEPVRQIISDIEQRTDAELVTVLAKQADSYTVLPMFWSALIALLTPGAIWLAGYWLETLELLFIQLFMFILLTLCLRFTPLGLLLIPKWLKRRRAAALARQQFLENNLHRTAKASGVLIFIAEAEHYVEILADHGISQHISQQQWQSMVDALIIKIKAGQTQEGLIHCINSCGELLAQYVPATEQKNELPNHLIILE